MLPNIALHKSTEPHWLPRDESKESSLHLLEQQEKEYNARLRSIANLAAPKPLGTPDPSSSHHQSATAYDGISRRSGIGVAGTVMASTPIAMRPAGSSSQQPQPAGGRSSVHSRVSSAEMDDVPTGGAAVPRNPYQSSASRRSGSSYGNYRRYRSSSSGVRRRRSYEEVVSFENDMEEDMTTAGNSDTQGSFSSDFP